MIETIFWRLRFQREKGQLTIQWSNGGKPPVYRTIAKLGAVRRDPLLSLFCCGDPMLINYLPGVRLPIGSEGWVSFDCQRCKVRLNGALYRAPV